MLGKYFTDHPREVGETYGEHFAVASGFGIAMVAGGLACIVHALVPAWCKHTASGIVRDLWHRMNGRSVAAPEEDTLEALAWVI